MSNSVLNNFYHSLKATVDKENSFCLFPEFKDRRLFRVETILGLKNKQETVSENDYNQFKKFKFYRVPSRVYFNKNKNEFATRIAQTLQEVKLVEEISQQFEARVVVDNLISRRKQLSYD